MPTCLINDQKASFEPHENIIEVARRIGIAIPYFCYHPGLSVVAQCRMCSVEIEKMPKLQTACSTMPTEGMKIYTQTPKVHQAQKSTMEFLLINHPLDCPICDKSGECDLQDHSYHHGSAYQRFIENRRHYIDSDMGPVIKKNMNRCIHCTRCIRFGDEVAKIREMVAVHRGNATEITTIGGKPLQTLYAGNYADICPTGSLTLKDFRFHKRVWFLKKTKTVCEGCSTGCALEVHHENNVIHRSIAAKNLEVNRFWICDEGRFLFRSMQAADRIIAPWLLHGLEEKDPWSAALTFFDENIVTVLEKEDSSVLVGSDLTLEELKAVQDFLACFQRKVPLYHFGTPNIFHQQEDVPEDALLRRTSKTSNLLGCELQGIKPYQQQPLGSYVLIFKAGRAILPSPKVEKKYGIGVFFQSEVESFEGILPSAGLLERSGSIINFQSKTQFLHQAVLPAGLSKPLGEILMLLHQLKRKKISAA